MSEDGSRSSRKVKTGLNSFKDLKLPIAEHSIAGYVALAKKTAEHQGRLRRRASCTRIHAEPALPEGSRQAHRLPHQADAGGADPRGRLERADRRDPGHQQQGRRSRSARSPRKAWASSRKTLAIAFNACAQKPQAAKHQVRLPDRRQRALRGRVRARHAAGAQEGDRRRAGADRRIPGEDSRRSARRSSKFFGVPYEPFKSDRIKPAELLQEPQARVRRIEPAGCRSRTPRTAWS